MKKLFLLSAILIFACSSDDSNDNNSNQTFLEKYDGIIWVEYEDIYVEGEDEDNAYLRFNNNLSNWLTSYSFEIFNGQTHSVDCLDIGDLYADMNNSFTITTNSENVLSIRAVVNGSEYIWNFSVTDGGNTLEWSAIFTEPVSGEYEYITESPRANISEIPCD
tara:strand:- start:42 stop:530 length:489 start_codon:yes stop_codon:yes gene_type:complete